MFSYMQVTGSRGVDMEIFGPSPHDCRRLTARLKAASSWPALRDLLPSSGALLEAGVGGGGGGGSAWAGVDTICLTAALSALARCATAAGAPPQRFASPLQPTSSSGGSGGVLAAGGGSAAHQSPARASAEAAIQRAEMASAASALLALSRPRLPEFDAQGLVTIAVSVAKLHEAPGMQVRCEMGFDGRSIGRLVSRALQWIWDENALHGLHVTEDNLSADGGLLNGS